MTVRPYVKPTATELRPIPGCPIYYASADGRIWSTRKGKVACPPYVRRTHLTQDGYPCLGMRVNGKSITFKVHRLILLAFVGYPPAADTQCDHINGVRDDNRVENLRWVTPTENMRALYARVGPDGAVWHQGARNGNAKLTWDTVRELRHMFTLGVPQKHLVRGYGINKGTVSHIILRKTWKERV